jgi:phospho-N-acetylmuramoyl-pentapeptide-transferase
MLYHLFKYLHTLNFPGAGLFQYISFRSAAALILSLLFGLFFGKKIIRHLQKMQIGEEIRELGLEGQMQKKGTPTMGGIIIIGGMLIPVILFCDLTNIYILLMLITTIWLGLLGFIDDYIKVVKHDKKGLYGRFKILGQISLGLIVGLVLWLSPEVVVREKAYEFRPGVQTEMVGGENNFIPKKIIYYSETKSTITTIPFFKQNEFNYQWLVPHGLSADFWKYLLYICVVIFIITAVSNGANMTDGLDGLATGTSAIIVFTLGILAYVSGNIIIASYLNIMYIPRIGELVIFLSALIGALIGFLWYNTYPAQVFMGDTGSLTLGGVIAVSAIIIRKEMLLPVLCGIFLVENLSVILQVRYFKYTKKKYGAGRRIFRMAPIHHHFQKRGLPEAKIVTRFWVIGILLAVISLATLKIR